jgi:D-ribose pyranose/furanose isomerase RbsD
MTFEEENESYYIKKIRFIYELKHQNPHNYKSLSQSYKTLMILYFQNHEKARKLN